VIFITLGTQKFQFDRLLKQLDELIDEGKIKPEELVVQCAYSKYVPKNYTTFFMKPQNEIEEYMRNAELIITHSGTGSIITALKLKKKIIIVPRLKKFDEHVDNHQVELAEVFKEKVNVLVVEDMEQLYSTMQEAKQHQFGIWESDNQKLINALDEDIKKVTNKKI